MMESMSEVPNRISSTALPSISHMESSKSRDDEQYRPRQSIPSPIFRFGATSYEQHSKSGLMSPPDSRRTSSEEQRSFPGPPAPVRQSLPSIHEALGRDSALNYAGAPPPPPPTAVPTSTSTYFTQQTATATVAEAQPRGSPKFFPPPSFSSAPPPPLRRASTNGHPGPSPTFSSHGPKIPSLQPIHVGNSPPAGSGRPNGPYTPSSASSNHEPSPHSAPAHSSFGYPGYQSQYRPATTVSTSYSTSPAVMSAPPQYSGWQGDAGPRSPLKPLRAHDSSVKRNLSQFDLEAALYECENFGSAFVECSRVCAKRVRVSKNDGMEHVPSPEYIAQMATQMANMQRAFHRIQEISDAVHAEVQEHQKEMHGQYGRMDDDNGSMHDYHHGNGAVMAPDSKKRRGRAAPPGRCHSCNRAETPEWRRGPDGARTLCNACGLHYAKLTRKMGPQQKANLTSSNLRPKGT